MFFRQTPKILEFLKSSHPFRTPFSLVRLTNILTPAFHTLNKATTATHLSLTNTQIFGFKFIGIPKRKGMRSQKHKTKKNCPKKRGVINIKYLHRCSNHNGLLKRVKIVGPRWDRKFKFKSSGARHLMRNKSKANRLRKRKPRLVEKCDEEKMRKMIPYYKRKKTKDLH